MEDSFVSGEFIKQISILEEESKLLKVLRIYENG